MNVLIIGKTSNLAKHIYYKFSQNNRLKILNLSTKTDFDYIKDFKKLEKLINKFKPKYIFNLAAINKFKNCEKNPKLAYEVNAFFPHKLSILCKKNNIFFFHFSTDAVFSGTVNKLNETSDIPKPNTIYGKSKLYGDNLIIHVPNSLIIRLPMLYGKYFTRSFVADCINNIKRKKNIYLARDIYCSPINASDVADFLFENIFQKKRLKYLLKKKLIHLSNNKRFSRFSFIKTISNSKYINKSSYKDLNLKILSNKYMGLKSNVQNFKYSSIQVFIDEMNL